MAETQQMTPGQQHVPVSDMELKKLQNKKNIYAVLAIALIIPGVVLIVLPEVSDGIPLIMVLLGIAFAALFYKNSQKAKRLIFMQLYVKGMSEHFHVLYMDYLLKADEENAVWEAYNEICGHTGGDNIVSKRKFYYERPQIYLKAEYKGVPFQLVEYKRISADVDKNGNVIKNNEPVGMYFSIDMPGITSREVRSQSIGTELFWFADSSVYEGLNLVTFEDIEFNKEFVVEASDNMSAYRLFTPSHIVKTKETFEALKSKKIKDMHFRFANGKFSALSTKKSGVSHFWVSERTSMDKVQKGIEESVEFVKTVFDKMALDTEKYTLG